MRFTAVFILVALMAPSMIRALAFGHYLLDYNRYVTELCENRDNIPMHCNGKCALKKNLKKSETPAHKPSRPVFKTDNIRGLPPEYQETFNFNLKSPGKRTLVCFSAILTGAEDDIFHPPNFLA